MEPWVVTGAAVTVALLLAVRLLDRERRLRAALERAALIDPLTGLLAEAGLKQRLAEEVERARRHGRSVALVLADVDGLRDVNAMLGAKAGDVALEQVGGILRDAGRRLDAVARLRGGEFALVLPDTDERGALAVAERLRVEIQEAFADGFARVTLSLGVAAFPKDARDGGSLLRAAATALALAKALGRNRAVVYDAETAGRLAQLTAG
ncbi:MAG TPA: GGDEF domain-containing protein [Thermodesulfobacteriota bacterium]